MKGFFKKLLALTVCGVIAFSTAMGLVACGGGGEKVDANRSQLKIGAYGGGYGEKWLQTLKKNFEEEYKDYEFEPGTGKKGVQVLYTVNQNLYTPGTLVNKINYDDNHVFFTSGEDNLEAYINNQSLLDITDIVTSPLSEYGESKSIEQKLNPAQIAHYKNDNKYYSLPDIESTQSVIYDVDLFEAEEFYFEKGGCPSEFSDFTQANNEEPADGEFSGYEYTGTGEKSAGPDGKYGTYDDGLPATYDEFIIMLDNMKSAGTNGMVWFEIYRNFFARALSVDYHGAEEGALLYTGGGAEGVETEIVTGFDNNGDPIITTKEISLDNYEDVARQVGTYYGLKLMEEVIDGDYVDSYAKGNKEHVEIQLQYLSSRFSNKANPIGLMIEGTWWETEAEAQGSFAECVDEYGEDASRANRRFGLFPMPKYSEELIGTKSTISIGSSTLFARGNIGANEVDLVKKFIRFVNSDRMLRQVTLDTGLPKALNYELSDTEKGQLNYFAKQFYEVSRISDKVYDYVAFDVKSLKNNEYNDIKEYNSYEGEGTNRKRRNAFDRLKFTEKAGQEVTAADYFVGMWLN